MNIETKKDIEVIDEVCTCGHLGSRHRDALQGLARGHGACVECKCTQFTWKGFVTK